MGRFDGKTERATPQRRKKARSEGTVARSQEIGVAASLLAVAFAAKIFGPNAFEVLQQETSGLIRTAAGDALHGERLTASVVRMILALAIPVLAVTLAAGLAAGVGQVGFKPSPKAAKPSLKKLDPRKGLEKLKPAQASWELIRTGTKLGLLLLLIWGPMREWMEHVGRSRSLAGGIDQLLEQIWVLMLRAMLLAVVIGVADYAWNRWRTEKQMRMSKDDVKREHKDTDGDPLMRAQRRRRQTELSRNRMLRDVATADVVVTNPTHLAVALRYEASDAAPRVVAKGADRLAAKIRQIAFRNGVTVTQDKPLARALYRRCKVGQFVPGALYEAVAVVLAIAYRRRGLLGSHRSTA